MLSAFIVTENENGPGAIAVSSKLPIKFVEMPTTGEIMAQAVTAVSDQSLVSALGRVAILLVKR